VRELIGSRYPGQIGVIVNFNLEHRTYLDQSRYYMMIDRSKKCLCK